MGLNLGKGLQSLIPPSKNKKQSSSSIPKEDILPSPSKESIFNVEVDKIQPNPYQPRQEMKRDGIEELAESIKEHGVLQPLIVTKVFKENVRGQDIEYQLVAGHRRLEAAKLVKLPHVPVVIRGIADKQKLEIALVENIQRTDLNAIERAQAFKRLTEEFNLSHQAIAQKVGKSREAISNTLRLLNLPLEIQEALISNQISEGHARSIINLKDKKVQKDFFDEIIQNRLSVRQVEQRYRDVISQMPGTAVLAGVDFKNFAQKLEKFLDCKVTITKSGVGGRIMIHFIDQPGLNQVVKKIISN